MEFTEWFETFIAEKNLPFVDWEIQAEDGQMHFLHSGVVIEHILATSRDEQTKIKNIIVKIDFANGDVNHFFKHLATGLVAQYGKNMFTKK